MVYTRKYYHAKSNKNPGCCSQLSSSLQKFKYKYMPQYNTPLMESKTYTPVCTGK